MNITIIPPIMVIKRIKANQDEYEIFDSEIEIKIVWIIIINPRVIGCVKSGVIMELIIIIVINKEIQ